MHITIGSSLQSRTRVKTLAYETIQANSRFFDNDINKVPHMALTVGVATVMDSREIILVITGQSKAWALAKSIEEGVNHLVGYIYIYVSLNRIRIFLTFFMLCSCVI